MKVFKVKPPFDYPDMAYYLTRLFVTSLEKTLETLRRNIARHKPDQIYELYNSL